EILKKLPARMKPSDLADLSAAALAERRPEIQRLSDAGLTSDALFLIENLEVSQSTVSASAVAFLKEKVSAAGTVMRGQWVVQAEDARRAGNHGQELRALTAIQRAYPDDREIAAKTDSARREVLSKLSLSLRDGLYLR